MFCGINATASTLLACIDLCCHTWSSHSSHHITACSARDERNRDNPEHSSTVTGSEAHRAAAAACTKLEKCDWHIFKKYYWIKTRLHSGLMGHVLLLFVSYSRAKKGKWIQAHAVLYLKRWRLFIWQKTPPHTEPEHFKVHHKTFHKPRDTAQAAGLYYD